MDRKIIVILFCLLGHCVCAQEFKVHSFRLLQNDITAWVNPVRDLNDEACALLKVVGDKDFVFSTPLGIVERRDEVGEIWLYLPRGTMKLTIKHPRWGVLRDYKFPSVLESRLTYELVLESPVEPEKESPYPRVRPRGVRGLANESPLVDLVDVPGIRKSGRGTEYFLLATWGIQEHEQLSGLMLGFMKRHGFFVHGQTNLKAYSTMGECDENGLLTGENVVPYYEPEVDYGVWTLTAGGVHRLVGLWHLYEGVGYGERKVVWETLDGLRLLNKDYSVKGWTVEMGCLVQVRRMAFTAGILTIKGDYWLPSVGVGISF